MVALKGARGGTIKVGGPDDQEIIKAELQRFCRRLIAARRSFFKDFVRNQPVDLQCVTGGGSIIRFLSKALSSGTINGRTPNYLDLLDPSEPERALVRNRAVRRKRNQELARGASAIGGSSVFFG